MIHARREGNRKIPFSLLTRKGIQIIIERAAGNVRAYGVVL